MAVDALTHLLDLPRSVARFYRRLAAAFGVRFVLLVFAIYGPLPCLLPLTSSLLATPHLAWQGSIRASVSPSPSTR